MVIHIAPNYIIWMSVSCPPIVSITKFACLIEVDIGEADFLTHRKARERISHISMPIVVFAGLQADAWYSVALCGPLEQVQSPPHPKSVHTVHAEQQLSFFQARRHYLWSCILDVRLIVSSKWQAYQKAILRRLWGCIFEISGLPQAEICTW